MGTTGSMYNPLNTFTMSTFRKNDATTKVRILKPILDDWNAVQGDTWVVEKSDYDSKRSVVIRRADRSVKLHENIHGSLAHDITCVCNAYSWCWAIYFSATDGLYMSI